jgi:hypothetical protein
VKDVSLEEGLAEILRVDPDLCREVRGNVVLVRRR